MSPMPPPTLGIRHVALTVKALAPAEAFYVGILGYTVEWRPDPQNVYLHLAGDNLALHQYAVGTPQDQEAFEHRRGQHLDHFGIVLKAAADVDLWAAHLKSHGVKLSTEPKSHRDGARSFYVQDPDGNLLQFIHHPPISDRA